MSGGQDVLAEQLNGGFDEMEYREMTPGLPVEDGIYLCESNVAGPILVVIEWKNGGYLYTDGEANFPLAIIRNITAHWRIPPEKPAPLAVGLYRIKAASGACHIACVVPDGKVLVPGTIIVVGDNFTLNPSWTITEVLANGVVK